MRRRHFLAGTAKIGATAGVASLLFEGAAAASSLRASSRASQNPIHKLTPPAKGGIPVAFVITKNATVIDFAGPWEVFQDVQVDLPGDDSAFHLYTVSDTTDPVDATAGLKIIPNFSYETSPPPKIIVIGAQAGRSKAMLDWIRKSTENTDVTMSVCTGAFVLGAAGMLDGLETTTHHDFQDKFAQKYPKAKLERGIRFVENDRISSAGGLTSGIDLALHVVERYYGRDVAQKTADYMEYQGQGWKV